MNLARSAGVLAAMVPIPFLITLGGFLVTRRMLAMFQKS